MLYDKILDTLRKTHGDGMATENLRDMAHMIMNEVMQDPDRPKPSPKNTSVLQDWVIKLPLREQGTLLTAVRGCDLTPKYPLASLERRLVGAIRAAFMNAADPREIDSEPGCFFISKPPTLDEFKPSAFGHYPQHWVSHVLHAMEVIAYRHPEIGVAIHWLSLYQKLCHSLHLQPETREQMIKRLGEDRIANGTVVS